MCVKIVKSEEKIPYNVSLPLLDQIKGSKEILIDCEPDCPKVIKLMDELETYCKNGSYLPIKLKMVNSNNLKLFKKTKEINKEFELNDIISLMVQFHKKADDKLKELSQICTKGNRNE